MPHAGIVIAGEVLIVAVPWSMIAVALGRGVKLPVAGLVKYVLGEAV